MGKKRESKGGSSNKRSSRRGEDSEDDVEDTTAYASHLHYEDEGDDDMPSHASPMKGSSSPMPGSPMPVSASSSSTFDMSEAMEMLREKKLNLREPGLMNIIKFLQSSRQSDEINPVDNFHDTLITLLLRMIRKPASVKEGQLACQLLTLLALYFGADNNDLLEQFEKPLQQCVDGKGPEFEDLRTNAVFTLTFVAFTCGNEESITRIIEYLITTLDFESLEGSGVVHYTPLVKAKALECLTLLATMLSPQEVLERIRDGNIMDIVQELLEADSNDIVSIISAGKSMAFFWEVANKHIEESANGSEPAYMLSDNPRVVEEVIEAIQRIAKDSSKKVSKKNRKEQRAEFRDVIEYLAEGEFTSELIHMQGADVDIESFSMRVIVDALREVLGSGFHSSLRLYPVVKEMLGVEFVTDDMDGGGSTNKITKGSSEDKRRSMDRKQDRRYRDTYNDFGGDYDD